METRRRTGLRTAGTVLLAVIAGVFAAALFMDWLVIDVRTTEAGAGPSRVWLPVPVAALRLAAALVPDDVLGGEPLPQEIGHHLPAVRNAVETLERSPDFDLVRVETDEAHVLIAKRGRTLVLDVRAPDATIHGSLPLRGCARAISRWNGATVDRTLLRSGLALLDDGFELSVRAEEATVRITVR